VKNLKMKFTVDFRETQQRGETIADELITANLNFSLRFSFGASDQKIGQYFTFIIGHPLCRTIFFLSRSRDDEIND
jgi:hypothetical protein